MKKLIFIIVEFFLVIPVFSQNKENRNEISVNLFELTKTPNGVKDVFENSLYFICFSNIKYKRLLNDKNAVRFIYYRPFIKKITEEEINQSIEKKYAEPIFVKLGYEYRFSHIHRFMPYWAIDMLYLHSVYSTIIQYHFSDDGGIFLSRKNIFGLTSTAGISYKLSNSFYIGLESNISLIYTKEIRETGCLKSFCTYLEKRPGYFEYIYSPVAIDVKILF